MGLRANVYPYTSVKQTYMSDADTGAGDNGPEMVQINLRLSKSFLEDIDTTWEEQGFNSRSEFLRYAARDAVKHPEFSREGWKQIAASEHELRSGNAELVSREEVVEMMDRGEDDE
jgi:Arc/MetJ-type ribon-helix-helix transcriptional regulator